jgi:peptide/nickel transport system substrate-binding protein
MITRRTTLTSLAALLAAAAGERTGLAQAADSAKKSKLPALIEPPMLEPLVQSKELPPIGKRVPEAPWIVSLGADEAPGEYGGDLRLLMARDRDTRFLVVYGYARLVGYDENLDFVADLCERYTVEEGRVFTFYLRKGHRWNTGRPFTAEDFRYFWEDVANDKVLGRFGLPQDLLVEGEKPSVEFPDQTTVRYSWSKPNPRFLPALAGASPLYIFRPSHYLKRFHIKYADKKRLEELKEKYKDERGWAREHTRRDRAYRNSDPRLPTLEPWVLKTQPPSERFEFHRNPFFHRIDSNGRQLPYIDRVLMVLAESKIIPAKTGAGESDLQARSLRFDDFTFLKRAAIQRSTFDVRLWSTANGAQLAFYPNLNVEDGAWRKLMRDARFRRALSLAINRREINEIMYMGLAKPGANTVLPGCPLYRPEYREAWARFDLAAANRLLDEIGLARSTRDGMRMLPEGGDLELIVEYPSEGTEYSDSLRLIGDSWRRAGIKLFSKSTRRELLRRRVMSGQCMMSYWGGVDFALLRPEHSPREFVPLLEDQPQWPQWGLHTQTGGKRGEKPDDPAALELIARYHEWFAATADEQRRAAWERILATWADQVYTIGIVGSVLQPVVVNSRLHNVPKEAVYAFDPGSHFGIYRPDTFWFSGGETARGNGKPG